MSEVQSITLTVREILDLAKAANIVAHGQVVDADEAETEYTITTSETGVVIKDDDGTDQTYPAGTFLTDYPDEGTYPLGEPIATRP